MMTLGSKTQLWAPLCRCRMRLLLFVSIAGLLEPSPASNITNSMYGSWITDRHGLPAFDYRYDEIFDHRGDWRSSEVASRRDHAQMFGNNRINAMAVDEGYVQLFHNERGPTWINQHNESNKDLSGGFSYVAVSGGDFACDFASAFAYAPKQSILPGRNVKLLRLNRTFGVGYYSSSMEYCGIRVERTVYAPQGDDPVLIDDVKLTNLRSTPVTLRHFEYWDLNRIQLVTQMYRSGLHGITGDAQRWEINGNFTQFASMAANTAILSVTTSPKGSAKTIPPRSQIDALDYYPPTVFLAPLCPQSASRARGHVNQTAFFGKGPAGHPDAVRSASPSPESLRPGETGPTVEALGQPLMLALETAPLPLQPGASTKLRYGFGYLPAETRIEFLARYRPHPNPNPNPNPDSWLVIGNPPLPRRKNVRAEGATGTIACAGKMSPPRCATATERRLASARRVAAGTGVLLTPRCRGALQLGLGLGPFRLLDAEAPSN